MAPRPAVNAAALPWRPARRTAGREQDTQFKMARTNCADQAWAELSSSLATIQFPAATPIALTSSWARSGDDPLSVRGHPSTVKGASRFLRKWPPATLDCGASVPPPDRTKSQAGACPDRPRAIPCTVQAGSMPARRVTD